MNPEPTPAFDVYAAPLAGLNLVEASAGTGKTWTISGLYARLILEQGLPVDQILVVTFTKAATAELQDRIRTRLRDVAAAIEAGQSEDPFCRHMAERYAGHPELALRRLTRAIGGFDQAAVFTIHSFCQRVLTDSAFESGADFDCEVVPDERELLGEIVDDFWRREVYPASEAWAAFLAQQGESPDQWLQDIAAHVGKPFLEILGAEEPEDCDALEQALRTALGHAAWVWQTQKAAIESLLLGFQGFNGNKIRPGKLREWLDDADAFFAQWPMATVRPDAGPSTADPGTGLPMELPEALAKLSAVALAGAVRKGIEPPAHAFFDRCEEFVAVHEDLRAAYAARLLMLKRRLLEFCNGELETRKARQRVFSYNDLLNRLAMALEAGYGPQLSEAVRRRYRAALIDEFQDTDPTQYRIFRTVFGEGGGPVFFVGDPKQAIYSFRGADVFSYLEARSAAGIARGTLMTNQRSVAALIAAVNRLFLGRRRPFFLDAIPYPEVGPATRDRPELLTEGEDGKPFRFLLLPAQHDDNGKEVPYTKGQAATLAAEATAQAIARLLADAAAGRARLGDRPVNGGDVAVLVATHIQGRLVEEQLRARGVPSVRQGQESVFQTWEAEELERVLLAVAQPGREPLLKAALATELMGHTANAIQSLEQDEPAWESVFERFQTYHQLWLGEGFMPMFRRWFEESRITEHLPAFRDGERRLTNLLHLAELLQVESREKPGLEPLLNSYAHAIHRPRGGAEEHLLRLESDARRVRIATVHTSKGLEYPIVFCPFLWDGRLSQRKAEAVLFHDAQYRAALDLGSPGFSAHREIAVREEMSEKLRLLYVALTRAVYRCTVIWGDVRNQKDKGEGVHTTALAWLLHGNSDIDEAADPLAALAGHMDNAGHARIAAEVHAFAATVPDSVSVHPVETGVLQLRSAAADGELDLSLRRFRRTTLYPSWRMSSFSRLATGRHSEAPDYDLLPEPRVEETGGESMFAFPRGAQAGSCLHAILEEWEFTNRDGERLAELAHRKLKAHGIDEAWTGTVRTGIETLLNADLDGKGLKLAEIPPERRLPEMEFTFALKGGDAARLRQMLANPRHGCDSRFAEAARYLDFHHIEGYMKGYIDLVFEANGRYYLADYKSNWLGNTYSDYKPDRLAAAMAREHYYLQYFIYTVALHRHLANRMPDYDYDRHFGGVYYLFLRGIQPRKRTGIFQDRPALSLVEELEAMFR